MSIAASNSLQALPPDGRRRLGQALVMSIGQNVNKEDLIWARTLLGSEGDRILWEVLVSRKIIEHPTFAVSGPGVVSLLRELFGGGDSVPRLVWTLPTGLGDANCQVDTYLAAALEVVRTASKHLTLVSPYIEPRGVGHLLDALVAALGRGVGVTIVTHGAEHLASPSSKALEELRREAGGLPGALTVFTASSLQSMLLHSKIIVADEARVIVGSANITGQGLGANLEAGVLLGPREAVWVSALLQRLLRSPLVALVFSTGEKG